MALPQLPAHVVHKLGQHSRVIQEVLSTREYAKESRPFRSALFRACGLSNIQGTFRRFLFKYFFLSKAAYAWGWRSASDGTSSIASEESPLWGVSAIHRTKSILLVRFAWLSNYRLPNHTALFVRNICFHRCILCLLFPNCIRVLFPKKHFY